MITVFAEKKNKLCICECVFISERRDKDDKNKVYCWDVKASLPSGRVEPLVSCDSLNQAKEIVKLVSSAVASNTIAELPA